MKEYRFRAWDKKNHEITTAFTIDADGKIFLFDPEDGEYEYVGYSGDSLILMQYTGLKDKNGKPIYEGDICLVTLKYFHIENERSKVIFKDGCFCFQYGFSDSYVKTYSAWDTNSVEVIGNIYENPELLKGSDGKC